MKSKRIKWRNEKGNYKIEQIFLRQCMTKSEQNIRTTQIAVIDVNNINHNEILWFSCN